MKFKAIILSFLILFGGSGLSIDLAQCCNRIAGVSISLGAHHDNVEDKDCCHCIKIKKNKDCCNDVVFQTPINSVLFNKIDNKKSRIEFPVLFEIHSSNLIGTTLVSNDVSLSFNSHSFSEIPLLLKKRVLQI